MAGKTKVGALQQSLATLNPWWQSATWETTDSNLRDARRSGLGYAARPLEDLEQGGLYVLRGPRRVGKTVATKQTIARLIRDGTPPLSIVRLAADGMSASDIRTVVQNIPLPGPQDAPRWWFIDEVTGATGEWAKAIKWLRDNIPAFGDGTVVLTGSQAEKLTEAKGSWPGRRGALDDTDRTLLPIGFRTWVNLVYGEAPTSLPRLSLDGLRTAQARDAYREAGLWLNVLAPAWELYLRYGGFPVAAAAAKQGQPIPRWFLKDVFDVIYKDIFADSRMDETSAAHLVERVWEGIGSPLNLSTIAQEIGERPDTVGRHVGYLKNGYLAWGCPQRREDRWTALAGAQAKVYPIDPLIAQLAHLRNGNRQAVDTTLLSELMIGAAIRRAAVAEGHEWEADALLFHWRTPTRNEIDFVAELLGGVAVEGKYVEDGGWRGEALTVEASEWQGILATRNVLDVSSDAGAWAVPCGVFAYLVDV